MDEKIIIFLMLIIGLFFIVGESVVAGELPINLSAGSLNFIVVSLIAVFSLGFILVIKGSF